MPRHLSRVLGLVLATLLLAAACLQIPSAPTPSAPPPQPAASPAPVPTIRPPAGQPSPTPGVPAGVAMLVDIVRADLARRLGVDAQAIAVLRTESVDWPSTALGCPEPGMVYAQVITPGYRVVLEHGGRQYTYHTDRRQRFVLCTR
ncbi:MAG: hypothetical protein HY691_05395 [Chloroflexi bacterium]|nr:hypothetical protein [Chloroflexota bacterium]